MRRWMSLAAALLLAGCGPEFARSPASTGDPGAQGGAPAVDGPLGTVSLPIVANTAFAKIVVKRNDSVTVPVFDPDTGAQTGTQQVLREVWRYVTNVAPNATTLPIPIGANYTIEVFAGDAQSPRQILAYYESDPFTVAASTPVSPNFNPFVGSTLGPTLSVPSIYAGLGPPYDKFTVTLTGVQYPWSSAGWTLTSSTGTGTKTGTSVSFPSPGSAGNVTVIGRFQLDSSLLVAGETSTDWQLTVNASIPTVATGSVTVIPPG